MSTPVAVRRFGAPLLRGRAGYNGEEREAGCSAEELPNTHGVDRIKTVGLLG
jgi:hypothetical protein